MQLAELMRGMDVAIAAEAGRQEITGLAYHSGRVRPGNLFVAIAGGRADGATFVPAAVAAGAAAVVSAHPVPVPAHVANVVTPDPRRALAELAARYYGDPSRAVRLVGVTGTNGKTTATYLLEAVWRSARRRPGVIGTVNVRYNGVTHEASTTTPESLDLQATLAAMRDAGVQDIVMEVSSHALIQSRVVACHLDGALFTNLTQDHLDYHASMEDYAAAKERLFTACLAASAKPAPWAAINMDDAVGAEFAARCPARVVRYGVRPPGDAAQARGEWVYAAACACTIDGIRMEVVTPAVRYPLQSPLIGRFNAANCLGVAAAAHAMGIPPDAVQAGIRAVQGVPGRMEAVSNPAGLTVLVDYAHTPDALRNVLAALRDLSPRRILTVFGCGGDRDPGKRPLMGAEVARGSDLAFVTSDNPRTEDPAAIIAAIVPGFGHARAPYRCIADRRAAIHAALAAAGPGDAVLIAGKGHEDYQIVGTVKRHFDDREVVREYFEKGQR
ncbi:MAG: UDP-N-acetylmuramoyl-L-alanyl-D-glutamate--2,6-diaminopimelate ligase [Deltaproteobacteria bacterium]|nr:UDP-N-acetylmuramoyl-L-alanyl-D-glutamate--2,6-diaminopimelate ligase [Deltaproteobacteria bacterium]